ncbi:hypothetical protein BHE74_00009563 [Ensete ventricosum]|nr:hypothetical protein BHE74_00009563 [Ensete ventricosum]
MFLLRRGRIDPEKNCYLRTRREESWLSASSIINKNRMLESNPSSSFRFPSRATGSRRLHLQGPTSKPAKASRRKRSVSKLSGSFGPWEATRRPPLSSMGARIAAAPEDRKPTSAAALFAGRGDAGRLPRVAELKARRAQRLAAEEEDINEVADAFIRRFREDLHLQSIENYNQMLARGL